MSGRGWATAELVVTTGSDAVDLARRQRRPAGEGPTTPLESELLNRHPLWDELEAKGVQMIIAAGNENLCLDAERVAPASLPRESIIVVMAIDPAGLPARGYDPVAQGWRQYSNWGRSTVHVAAPGTMVIGIPAFDLTSHGDGTSCAAPVVAAAAAILWGQHPDWDHLTVKRANLELACPVDGLEDKCLTGGTLDLKAALQWSL